MDFIQSMTEQMQIDWAIKLREFDEAFEEANRLFSIYSLLAAGISLDDEEINILNAQIVE